MEKLTKTLILLALLIVTTIFFSGYSDSTEVGATILFPFLFAIIFYLIVLNIFSINFDNKKYNVLMALFIGGIAMFSTAIGYHYSSNSINNLIITTGNVTELDVQERIFFMDEYFSHWVMVGGILIMSIAIIMWGINHYKSIKSGTKQNKKYEKEAHIIDNFIIIFMGTATGVILGLLSISGNVTKYGLMVVALVLVVLFWKFKTIAISKRGFELLLYASSAISGYVSLLFSFYLIYKSNYLCNFLLM